MRTRARQRGVTMVEFAIVGTAAMIVLFAVIEVGRAMFVVNTLNEVTRRSARMAAVCPINDPAIREVGLFNSPGDGTGSRFISGLAPGNLTLEYLNQNGDPITDPSANFGQIHFVRTRIVGYQHEMLIPFLNQLFTTPEFGTTLRRDTQALPPQQGAVLPC